MFTYEIKFLTCDGPFRVKNTDITTFNYETRKKIDENIYDAGKRQYCERRGGQWRSNNTRKLRQLDSKLHDRSVLACAWISDTCVSLVFSSGTIAYLTMKTETLDVIKILFDKYCVGKLTGQCAVAAVLCKTHLLFIHAERVATLVTFGKNTTHDVPHRISDRDPYLQSIELGGRERRADKRVSWCEVSDGARVLIWSPAGSEPAPWSPELHHRANLHLYQLTGTEMNLLAYHQLENETLLVEHSVDSDGAIHIIEQSSGRATGITVEWAQYKVCRTRAQGWSRTEAVHACLPAAARVARRARQDSVLLACIDGSLHVLHRSSGITHSSRTGVIPTDVRWCDELCIVLDDRGRLQFYDQALSSLHLQSKCLDVAAYLRESHNMRVLSTRNSRGRAYLLTTFTGGPLTLIRITYPHLLTTWIRIGRLESAVSLLCAMDWESRSCECLRGVSVLVQRSLRDNNWELAIAALGAFLAPKTPLPPSAERLAPHIHDLARKLHHHLLRRGEIEKALSLGVELGAWDLFADSAWAARRLGHAELAEEAASLARHPNAQRTPSESECSDSCSQCSGSSCSDADEDTAGVPSRPPPLPRLRQPSRSTLLSVPIHTNEASSTTSIRPNLHQYLERDNTIWNTTIEEEGETNASQQKKRNSVENLIENPSVVPFDRTKFNKVLGVSDNTPVTPFESIYRTEFKEDAPSNLLYRYYNNDGLSGNMAVNGRTNKRDNNEKVNKASGEKNKVKFSDTVTVTVVSDNRERRSTERELAESLPIGAPHNYLAAFEPLPPRTHPAHSPHTQSEHVQTGTTHVQTGTTHDYVEV